MMVLKETEKLGVFTGVHEDDDDDFAVCYTQKGTSPVPAIQNLLDEFDSIHHGHVNRRDFHRRMRGVIRVVLIIELLFVAYPNTNPFVRRRVESFARRLHQAAIADRFIRRKVHQRLEKLL